MDVEDMLNHRLIDRRNRSPRLNRERYVRRRMTSDSYSQSSVGSSIGTGQAAGGSEPEMDGEHIRLRRVQDWMLSERDRMRAGMGMTTDESSAAEESGSDNSFSLFEAVHAVGERDSEMPSIENNKILVLGDFHLMKAKNSLSSSTKLNRFVNMTWKCSNWQTIKTAKKEYFKYKAANGNPSVVILQVGNNDLTKVSTPNCVISSLLRTAQALYKTGVSAVVICSLVERELTHGNFNAQVNKVNAIVSSKAAKIEWLHFFVMLNSKLYSDSEIYSSNKRDLLTKPLDTIIDNLKELMEGASFVQLVKNDEQNTRSCKKINGSSNSGSASNKISVFESEVSLLKLRLNLMLKEKTKADEQSAKLDNSIVLMTQYLSQLQSIGI